MHLQKHEGVLHIKGTPIKRHGTFYVTDEAQAEIEKMEHVIECAIDLVEGTTTKGFYAMSTEYIKLKNALQHRLTLEQ